MYTGLLNFETFHAECYDLPFFWRVNGDLWDTVGFEMDPNGSDNCMRVSENSGPFLRSPNKKQLQEKNSYTSRADRSRGRSYPCPCMMPMSPRAMNNAEVLQDANEIAWLYLYECSFPICLQQHLGSLTMSKWLLILQAFRKVLMTLARPGCIVSIKIRSPGKFNSFPQVLRRVGSLHLSQPNQAVGKLRFRP